MTLGCVLLQCAKNLIDLSACATSCRRLASIGWTGRARRSEQVDPAKQRRVAPMNDPGEKRFGALPSASGTITRLAHAQVKATGCDALPLLKKAGLTVAQIDDPATRLNVRDQICYLNLAADAVQDDFLGFHLAQPVELRELGLLYYVMASSESLGEALRRCARYSSIVNEGV